MDADEDKGADEVMLRPEYAERLSAGRKPDEPGLDDLLMSRIGCPLTREELRCLCVAERGFRLPDVLPYLSSEDVVDRKGRRTKALFVGLKGTF